MPIRPFWQSHPGTDGKRLAETQAARLVVVNAFLHYSSSAAEIVCFAMFSNKLRFRRAWGQDQGQGQD